MHDCVGSAKQPQCADREMQEIKICLQMKKAPILRLGLNIGAGTKSRTRDLLITSQLLYQLSYTGNRGAHYAAIQDC